MPPRRFSISLRLLLAAVLVASGGLLLAQDADVTTPSMQDATGSYEVSGIRVDVTGKTADAARLAGWRIAQRQGWLMLGKRLGVGAGQVSDGTLDSMVTGIIVENEQIGPNRYIARLGVLFSRGKAGAILGVAGDTQRSTQMLTIPIEYSGGAAIAFEQESEWQKAWARFRTANTSIDYVRPNGTGGDSLLLNLGQVTRPGRAWWRTVLDQYGSNDVLVPIVRLSRQWPGGPVIGAFEARHGPDSRLVTRFTLRVSNGDAMAALLDEGVKRIDAAYQAELSAGGLQPDSSLAFYSPIPTPTPTETPTDLPTDAATGAITLTPGESTMTSITVQVDTASAGAVTATESALRGLPGVRSANTTSLALGGVSVMRVTFDADPALFRAELEARGWTVSGSGTTFRIRRAGAESNPG
ncbi:heavy-metal-associated domain-containing protein [Sphingomonas immobilis]|uniref:Heavy-metal-associated domain-containing protein n=1 Tax=Sphingomonas immobilis TaxID=3063997 RepID=A0ABT9A1Z6_9SPHN|nr:heavy-metal-associated domain-containing protein [Sphingomonas sp. CA1-15]MDO7842737.1 heavy-metal-associated domain-containing protein [Sphingomonas sp. CA1-15]